MSNVEAVGGSSPISSAVAGGLNSGSIQFIFAQLQIELGIANKEAALDKINYSSFRDKNLSQSLSGKGF